MNYKFRINEFEGPLDLLLHLIKEMKMDIMNIEISLLTDQYLNFIKSQDNDLIIKSEYLSVASELIYLKSKYLLPNTKDDDDDDYEEIKQNLIDRLIEYKKYKEQIPNFKILEESRKGLFSKSASDLRAYNSDVKLSENVTLEDLINAFKKFLERRDFERPLNTKITTRELSVEDAKRKITSRIKGCGRIEFFDLFEEFSNPYIIVTFLAILELSKNSELVIVQENNFEKIYCVEAV